MKIITANSMDGGKLLGYARQTIAGLWYVFTLTPAGVIENHEPIIAMDEATARRKLSFLLGNIDLIAVD